MRNDFPVLQQNVNNHPLVYLDNAATTLKPQCVVDKICEYYNEDCANIHRGVHTLSMRATEKYEKVRHTVQKFINAKNENEIIFTKGTTDSLNLLASSLGKLLNSGDEILVTGMEHHSNIVPWQMLHDRGIRLKYVPITQEGTLDLQVLEDCINEKTKVLSFVHVSNALGTLNPVKEILKIAKKYNLITIIDGAQAVAHLKVDVQELDCDFYAFSGHKIYGPTGVGVLYGKHKWLEKLPPYQGGGDMIRSVSFEKTTYNDLPYKFEAGTPAIAQVIGLGEALEYLNRQNFDKIIAHERQLMDYIENKFVNFSGLKVIGPQSGKVGAVSFILEGIHPHDIGSLSDNFGVAVRTGHHCAQPIMTAFGIPATTRASFGLYNTEADIEKLISSLKSAQEFFL